MPLADATQTEPHAKGRPADKSQRPRGSAGRRARAPAPRLPRSERRPWARYSAASASPSMRPRTELVLKRAPRVQGRGPRPARAVDVLRRFAEVFSLDAAYDVKITSAIPAHAGLGSGTQLALAVGAAVDGARGLRRTARRGSARSSTEARARPSAWRRSSRAASSSTAAAAPSIAPRPILVRTRFPGGLARAARPRRAHGRRARRGRSQGFRRPAAAPRRCGSASSAASFSCSSCPA